MAGEFNVIISVNFNHPIIVICVFGPGYAEGFSQSSALDRLSYL